MKNIFFFFAFLLLQSCNTRTPPISNTSAPRTVHGDNNNYIQIGIVDSLYSRILKENRKIWIYIPNHFNNPVFTGQQHYPIAYVLDGDAHFLSLAGMIDQLSEQNGNMICPDMIIVGILDTNRSKDYTPTTDTNAEKESGGGDNFTAFIEQELIPHIDSIYHPSPFRMLIGHSYGGLMVINTLLKHRQSFNAFVAIDPSLSWDNRKLLQQADTLLKKDDFGQKYLYIAIANTMSVDMNLDQIKRDRSPESNHIRSVLAFVDKLKQLKLSSLRWDYDYYDDEDHYSVPLRAEYDALHFVFRFYAFAAYAALFDSSISADSARRIIIAHFGYETDQLGYNVLPPEKFINDLGYSFMNSNMAAKAQVFFQMNITNYPESSNAYDSMGDFFNWKKDNLQANAYYQKALDLKNGIKNHG